MHLFSEILLPLFSIVQVFTFSSTWGRTECLQSHKSRDRDWSSKFAKIDSTMAEHKIVEDNGV